jgi:hypothetical protein
MFPRLLQIGGGIRGKTLHLDQPGQSVESIFIIVDYEYVRHGELLDPVFMNSS